MCTEFIGKNRVKEPFLKYENSVFKLCGRDEGVKYCVGVYTPSAEDSLNSW